MDEYANQLELLLLQDNFVEASNPMEKALTGMQIPSILSSIYRREPPMLAPPTKISNLIDGYSSQQQLADTNFYHHLAEYPSQQQLSKQNYLYQIDDGYHPHEQPLKENFYHVMGGYPPQHPQRHQVPLRGYVGLENQVPYIDQKTLFGFTSPNPTYLNPSGDPKDPNWEAINSFLLGQVRPGPEITRVYKCSICSIEFPNAQAFGGHMSSHSKRKRRKRISTSKGQFKKVKLNKKENKKVDYESDESVSSSFL